jgi:hypothetical protein
LNPGRITNEDILKPFHKYVRDDDLEDSSNFVIKHKAREGYDYKLIPKDVWMRLQTKYGGLELKRFKNHEYYTNRFDIKHPAVLKFILIIIDFNFNFASISKIKRGVNSKEEDQVIYLK